MSKKEEDISHVLPEAVEDMRNILLRDYVIRMHRRPTCIKRADLLLL